jgi:hypothetical protein
LLSILALQWAQGVASRLRRETRIDALLLMRSVAEYLLTPLVLDYYFAEPTSDKIAREAIPTACLRWASARTVHNDLLRKSPVRQGMSSLSDYTAGVFELSEHVLARHEPSSGHDETFTTVRCKLE